RDPRNLAWRPRESVDRVDQLVLAMAGGETKGRLQGRMEAVTARLLGQRAPVGVADVEVSRARQVGAGVAVVAPHRAADAVKIGSGPGEEIDGVTRGPIAHAVPPCADCGCGAARSCGRGGPRRASGGTVGTS